MTKKANIRDKIRQIFLNIKPSGKDRVAVIELTPEQKAMIENVKTLDFLRPERLKKGTRLLVSRNETLDINAHEHIKDGVMEIE